MWSLTFGEWSIRGVWVEARPDVLMWPQPGNVVSVNAGKLMRRETPVLDNLGLFSLRPSDSPSMRTRLLRVAFFYFEYRVLVGP